MADEQDPIDKIAVPPEAAGADADPHRPTARRAPETATIPEAELVEDRREPLPRPDPVPMREPAPAPGRTGAFLGFVLGGILAAATGFALAKVVTVSELPDAMAELAARVQQQEALMAALKKQIEDQPPPQMPDISADLAKVRSDFDARLAALPQGPDLAALTDQVRAAATAAVADLKSRVDALELRPAGAAGTAGVQAGDSDVTALRDELRQLRDQIASQSGTVAAGVGDQVKAMVAEAQSQIEAARSEATQLKAEAEAAGAAAMAQAALARVRAAIDGGGPFASAVADLTATGHEVPQTLADAAAAGVPTLADLQRSYPAAARAALDAALRADMGDSWTTRAAAFLRTQTGARSLTPLEGDDPDAILSRAEAALDDGDVASVLAELATLPDAAKPAMAPWVAEAQRRQGAAEAAASLSSALDAK